MHVLCRRLVKGLFAFALLGLSATAALADAEIPKADVSGSSDNPLVQRYEGSLIVYYEKFSYTDFTVPLSPLKVSADNDERDIMNNHVFRPDKSEELEGALTRVVYLEPEERSPLEILRNFQDMVTGQDGQVLFECKKEECGGDSLRSSYGGGSDQSLMMYFFHESDLKVEPFSNGSCALTSNISDQRFFAGKIPTENGDAYVTVQTYLVGDSSYCTAFVGRTFAVVHVLEPKARDKKMVVVKADEMASSLDTSGRIALYGLYFDTDKTDIKPESDDTLQQIATLLKDDPKLAVIIVGHTDNVGAFDYNLDLSDRRAKAVKAALIADYGVDGDRLTAAGVGMMAPVASNDEDAGRAKNRRVELVKLN